MAKILSLSLSHLSTHHVDVIVRVDRMEMKLIGETFACLGP